MPHRRRHGIGARRSRPGPDAREDPGGSQQERDSDAVQHRRTLPVADRQVSRQRHLLTESSPPRCMAGGKLCALWQRRAPLVLGQDMRGFSANTPAREVLSCRGQASNPILALRGEGKNEDAKSRPGRASSLRLLSTASCSRPLARHRGRADRPRHAAFFVASLPVPLHSGHSSTMRPSYMDPGT